MKKLLSLVTVLLVLIQISLISYAANAVPQEVVSACDSVVRIYADYGDEYALGTGFVISNDNNETLIVTNHHVAVADNPQGLLVLLNTDTNIQATVLTYDESKDLAVIKVAFPLGITPVVFSKDAAQKGDAIYAIGYPGAADSFGNEIAITKEDSTITDGIISAIRKVKITENGLDTEVLQITAAINPGNSGGPLVNETGEVVGICTYAANDSQGIFGAISGTEIKSFLDYNKIAYQIAVVETVETATSQEVTFPEGEKKSTPWLSIIGIFLLLVLVGVLVKQFLDKKRLAEKRDDIDGTSYGEMDTEKQNPISIKWIIVLCAGAAVIGLSFCYIRSYKQAVEFAKNDDTKSARESLIAESLTNLHDPKLVPYLNALDTLAAGDYTTAETLFKEVDEYLNSKEKLDSIELEKERIEQEERERIDQEKSNKYQQAMSLYNEHDYDGAYQIFAELGDYQDSVQKVEEIQKYIDKYNNAIAQEEKGEYLQAKMAFEELGQIKYRDSVEKGYECYRKYILDQLEKGEWADALRLADAFANRVPEGRETKEEVISLIYDMGVEAYHKRDKTSAEKYLDAVDIYGGHKRSDDYQDLIRYSKDLDGEYETLLSDKYLVFGVSKYFEKAISRLEELGELEDAKNLLSKMKAWRDRYEREEKEKTNSVTEKSVSKSMSYADIMNANFIGTWTSVVTEDWYSQKTIRITPEGAFVTEHMESRLFPGKRTDLDNAGPYEWTLTDRSDRGKCPMLQIKGYLTLYVSGIDDEKFWSDSQGLTFIKQ